MNSVVSDAIDVSFALLEIAFAILQVAFTVVVLTLLGSGVAIQAASGFLAGQVRHVGLFVGQAYFFRVQVRLTTVEFVFEFVQASGFVVVKFIGTTLGQTFLIGHLVVEDFSLFGEGLAARTECAFTLSNVGVTGFLLLGEVGGVLVDALFQFIEDVASLVLFQKFFADAGGFGYAVESAVNHIGDFETTGGTHDSSGSAADSGADESGSGDA